MTTKTYHIGFLGFGLIGGSIARAIKADNPDTIIQVYTRRKNPELEQGKKDGIISSLHYEIDEHFSACDFIFLCAPVLKNIEFLSIIKPFLKEGCILTDVGSVKGNIHTAVAELGLEPYFIGGHPMAGSEKTGYANSSRHLLERCFYLLTPTPCTKQENLEKLKQLLACTLSRFVILSPEKHDDITAAISHVPHIIAASLVNAVKENDSKEEYMKAFAAGGFKDLTRIASSSPDMWESICLSNQKSIESFLSCYIEKLTEFKELVQNGQGDEIRREFQDAARYRDSIADSETNKKVP